jgi:hypothetical protein
MIDPRLTPGWYFRKVTEEELKRYSRELQELEPFGGGVAQEALEARVAHRALLKRGKKPTLHSITREMRRRQEGFYG